MGEYADLAVERYINSFSGISKSNVKRNKGQKSKIARKRKALQEIIEKTKTESK